MHSQYQVVASSLDKIRSADPSGIFKSLWDISADILFVYKLISISQ